MTELNGVSKEQYQEAQSKKASKAFDAMITTGTQEGWRVRHLHDTQNKQILFYAEDIETGFTTSTIGVPYKSINEIDQEFHLQFSALIDEEIQLTKKMAAIVQEFVNRKAKLKLFKLAD